MTDEIIELMSDYEFRKPSAERFCKPLLEQIKELISQNQITTAVPIDGRVKSWSSTKTKLERSKLKIKDILELNDLVGVRLILLFKRDLEKCRDIIEKNLDIIDQENTADRLAESQFGYQSYHYVIKLKEEWLHTPTLQEFKEYRAEIQLRTIAQHIWAAASHHLQYKNEDNVPPSVRRSMYRASALLEIIDLEFERVLNEREKYIKLREPENKDDTLNVDIIKEILDSMLPMNNKRENEDYSILLKNLTKCDINTSNQLKDLISSEIGWALENEKIMVSNVKSAFAGALDLLNDEEKKYISSGIFYTHCGLVRNMLTKRFGKEQWLTEEFLIP